MDQQQPQWTPPPQQPAGWGGPGYGGAPVRPTGVTLASIYLIVMGVLFALGGAACGILGGGVSQIGDTSGLGGIIGGSLLVIGLIALVLGILQIAAGAGAMGGKGWARWTGIVISAILAVLLLLSAITTFGAENGMTSAITSLVIGVLYAGTAWAYVKASAFFGARS